MAACAASASRSSSATIGVALSNRSDGSTATRKFATDAPAGALLDWCDVRGVDLEAFVVRKAAGDRVVLDDRTSLLGDVLGARALLECVAR